MKSIGSGGNDSGRSYDSQDATVILLHGGPGLGKTVTTKYLAEHLGKPLISFSAGDLGATPDVVDANLAQYLKRAERWRAVLVMENADVILTQRSRQDIIRNSIVMTFQRALENYTGVIILTTTRVGSLDESIEAQIQVAIEYRDLDSQGRRRIWEDFIQEASENLRVDTEDLSEHLSALVKKPMNGKEILGAWKIALQMVGDGEKLRWEHLMAYFQAAESFNSYLEDTRGGTRAQLAHDNLERADKTPKKPQQLQKQKRVRRIKKDDSDDQGDTLGEDGSDDKDKKDQEKNNPFS
jgi:AAA+ superfamily predicted ATPase